MSLPKLTMPTYTTTLPMGKEVKYRPYTVGEEKILLTAFEGNDVKEIHGAIIDILDVCTLKALDIPKLKMYEVEYLFIKIRSKSVGSNLQLSYRKSKCPENNDGMCKDATTINVDLDDITVGSGGVSLLDPSFVCSTTKNLTLAGGIGATLEFPSYQDVLATDRMTEGEKLSFLSQKSIALVFDAENTYSEFTTEEMEEFYNSMTIDQKSKIKEFLDTMPIVRYDTEFKCQKCGKTEPLVIEGLEDFFG